MCSCVYVEEFYPAAAAVVLSTVLPADVALVGRTSAIHRD